MDWMDLQTTSGMGSVGGDSQNGQRQLEEGNSPVKSFFLSNSWFCLSCLLLALMKMKG